MTSQIPINIAFEDLLSEAVLARILQSFPRFIIGNKFSHRGFGYLKKNICAFNNASKAMPFLILTDLDNAACPLDLVNKWLTVPQHPNLLFRVAVREVEAWLIADSFGLAHFLSVNEFDNRDDVDQIPEPKEYIVNISRRSRNRSIRESIPPLSGSTSRVGPNYNDCLSDFVYNHWNIESAQQHSKSLYHILHRLSVFEPY